MPGSSPEGKVHQKHRVSIGPEVLRWDRRLRELEGLARDFQRDGLTRNEACVRAYVQTISGKVALHSARKP